jgi:hypothetical protein
MAPLPHYDVLDFHNAACRSDSIRTSPILPISSTAPYARLDPGFGAIDLQIRFSGEQRTQSPSLMCSAAIMKQKYNRCDVSIEIIDLLTPVAYMHCFFSTYHPIQVKHSEILRHAVSLSTRYRHK